MNLIVQKFGGSSVANVERVRHVAQIITDTYAKGNSVIAVVSAQGDTTDDLIAKAKEITDKPSSREMDVLLSTGEQISMSLLAMAIEQMGYPVISLTGWQAGFLTESTHRNARIKKINTERLQNELDKKNIVIVAGFQGLNRYDDITTLGRGGSDTSAVAIAAALKADKCEIYTDVDGVMTADPRIVKNAHIIKQISYDKIREMAHQGAKVIHPRAVEIVMRYGGPMVVKSTFSEAPGTLISKEDQPKEMEETDSLEEKHACGVASKNNIAFFSVNLDSSDGADLFDTLAKNGVSIGTMSLQPHSLMFAVYSAAADDAEKVLKAENCQYTKVENCAKVTVVGSHMGGVPGIMARFINALAKSGIEILQTTDSDNLISAIVREEQVKEAVNALHAAFQQ